MSSIDTTNNFATRLYAQLAPFQQQDTQGHLWALCDGIHAMFQEVETLTAVREDDLPGWANMVDINKVRSQDIGYLAQFVGAEVQPGLSDAEQRAYVSSLPGFNRGRPATIIAAVKATLTGTQWTQLVERQWIDESDVWHDDAWRYTVITKPSETPNYSATRAAIQSQKPGPDLAFYWAAEIVTYAWVALNYDTYADLKAAYPTYADLTRAKTT